MLFKYSCSVILLPSEQYVMKTWESNLLVRCGKNWGYFKNSGILSRMQWKVFGIPDQQTCSTCKQNCMLCVEEEPFWVQERNWLKCSCSNRAVPWLAWHWVKGDVKGTPKRGWTYTNLPGEPSQVPKNQHFLVEVLNENCPLTHHS